MFFRLTPMVKTLLLCNGGIFLITLVLPIDFSHLLGMHYVLSSYFSPYQFLSYMFVHGGLWHLIGNMFGLIMFGTLLEKFWGSKKFLIFYVLTGVGAGVLYAGIQFYQMQTLSARVSAYRNAPDPEEFNRFLLDYAPHIHKRLVYKDGFIDKYTEFPTNIEYIRYSGDIMQDIFQNNANIPMVGASGAIFGILFAFAFLFPNTELLLLFPPIPVKAKYLVAFYGIYELWAEISQRPGDNVAHLAHLGGMLVAFVLLKYWQVHSKDFY